MTIEGALRRWLILVNGIVAAFVALPFFAPVLLSNGLDGPANVIYAAYSAVCHQWAFRSYFLFGSTWTHEYATLASMIGAVGPYQFLGSPELGYKVAICERDVAMYLAVLLTGLVYGWRRGPAPGQVTGLGLRLYLLLILPMALDGFTQLFGWRESDALLRTITGGLFGAASVWLIYPRFDGILARDLGPATPRLPQLGTGVGAA